MLVTLGVTLVVGGRLLAVARRTRELPELLFGIGFVSGGIGQGFAQLGQRVIWTEPGAFATGMNTLLFGFLLLGTAALYVVIWRVYRPGWTTAGAIFTLAAMPLLCLSYGLRIAGGDFTGQVAASPGVAVHQALRGFLFGWAAIESLRYHALLRKRRAIGLADPVVTNQILLWGVAAGGMVGLNALVTINLFVLGRSPLADPVSTSLLLVVLAVVSVSMWCAFFPPQALRRRLMARAAANA